MRKQQIAVIHIGEDYATIEINGKQKEVSKKEGELILKMIKMFK